MKLLILPCIIAIFLDCGLACDCSLQASLDFVHLQAALRQINNQTTVDSGKKMELYRRSQGAPQSNDSNNVTRRDCIPNLDLQTGLFDGTYICDENWPSLQQIEDMFRNTGLVTNPALLPAYYTGWTEDQMSQQSWKGVVLDWLMKHTGTPTNEADDKLATGWYWYWNALPDAWFKAQLQQIEVLQNPLDPGDVGYNTNGWAFPQGSDGIFESCVSEAFARQCIHPTVILFAPKGYVLGSEGQTNRHWWMIEFPVLTNNPIVQTVLRVDPRPVAEGGDPCDVGVIWSRNVVPGVVPRPIVWTCPTAEQLEHM